jgi:hypothetical protein
MKKKPPGKTTASRRCQSWLRILSTAFSRRQMRELTSALVSFLPRTLTVAMRVAPLPLALGRLIFHLEPQAPQALGSRQTARVFGTGIKAVARRQTVRKAKDELPWVCPPFMNEECVPGGPNRQFAAGVEQLAGLQHMLPFHSGPVDHRVNLMKKYISMPSARRGDLLLSGILAIAAWRSSWWKKRRGGSV